MKYLFNTLTTTESLIVHRQLLAKYGEYILITRDHKGNSPLHHAVNALLVQQMVSVMEPQNREPHAFAQNNFGESALHWASKNSDSSLVGCLLALVDGDKDEYVGLKNLIGETALHCASNSDVAMLLLNAIDCPQRRSELLKIANYSEQTALHTAVATNRVDVMKCFLSPSLAIDTEELLFIHDELGNTPLHWADTVEQAKILLNAASPGKQDVLICEKNLEDKTVLFTACEFGRCPEVAKYLLSLDVDKDRLLFMTERGNATALNAVMGSDVAELLVLSVSKPRRREFVYNMNIFKQSALHSAAGRGDISVIKYLLGLDFVCDDLILARDKHGLTAMQWSETVEIMEAIVSRISQENFTKLLTEPSDYGHSPLHTACYRGKTDCVKYLLSYAVTHANLLDEVDEEGNTALHSAIKQGLTEMVEAILEFFAGDFDMIETLLQQTNSDGQNVFHLAMSDLKFAEFSKTLKEYQDMIDIAKVAKPDTKGNTLFHYAVGMFNLPQFAEQIMRLSLPDRIQVLLHTFNKRMKSVFAIGKAAHYEDVNRYFVEVVLGSDLDLDFMGAWLMLEGAEGVSRSGKVELTIDPRIMKLMMYAINQYPLNDIGVLKSMVRQLPTG